MKRKELKIVLNQLVEEFEKKKYDEWNTRKFPYSYEEDKDGETIDIELVLLENEKEYLQISVGLSQTNNILSQYFPVSTNFIVTKNDPRANQ